MRFPFGAAAAACAAGAFLTLAAAPADPVAWKIEGAPARVKAGARFDLKLVARIQDGWHMYSLKPVEDGPIPTRIWLAEGQPLQLAGPIEAAEPEKLQDPSLGMEVELYEGEADFTLPLRVAANAPAGPLTVVVNASYQSCNNKLCLPPKTVKVEAAVVVVVGR
ncbi:MAG TPA: protein-disulfide reductase DsbD N-terminal domain-containing protein [Bryobacteraceae bacterium]|nr:protein-disulfide reductase DsbD N-terminal domain-containing protein [Bryobacteraceae bacterium]